MADFIEAENQRGVVKASGSLSMDDTNILSQALTMANALTAERRQQEIDHEATKSQLIVQEEIWTRKCQALEKENIKSIERIKVLEAKVHRLEKRRAYWDNSVPPESRAFCLA